MTKEEIKTFLATPKGKLIAACSALVLCWVFLFIYYFSDSISALGNPDSIESAKRELRRQQNLHATATEKYNEWQNQKKRYRAIVDNAWQDGVYGQVETALRQKITEAVAPLDNKLSSLGSVNTGRINNDLYYADIDISAEGGLDEIVKLISVLEGIQPKPMWKRLNLRPDNRPRPKSSMPSVLNLAELNSTVEYTRVAMNATLRVICADGNITVASAKRSAKP